MYSGTGAFRNTYRSGFIWKVHPDLTLPPSTFCTCEMYRPMLRCVVVAKLVSEHIAYIGAELGNRSNVSKHKYLIGAVPTITVVDRETTPKDVTNAVQHKLHEKASYKAAPKV